MQGILVGPSSRPVSQGANYQLPDSLAGHEGRPLGVSAPDFPGNEVFRPAEERRRRPSPDPRARDDDRTPGTGHWAFRTRRQPGSTWGCRWGNVDEGCRSETNGFHPDGN